MPIRAAFELEAVVVAVDALLPTKRLSEGLKHSGKFKTIVASIREVGAVEPLSVFPHSNGKYLLLDGHVRVEALREIGIGETLCLISKDDEGYTYNHKVNRVAPIQANRMILKALEAGVSEQRIARTLNLAVSTVRQNRSMLVDICQEAIELLKDKQVSLQTFREMKKVRPLRQIEMAELMNAAATYASTYARALVVATPKDQLVDPDEAKKIPGMKAEDVARLEHDMHVIEKDFSALDETYSHNVMNLMMARGYLKKLVESARVARYLSKKHADVLAEFRRIVESTALEG